MSLENEYFEVKTTDSTELMKCTVWTDETRVFENKKGFIEMDWMEYLDQVSLGRIRHLPNMD